MEPGEKAKLSDLDAHLRDDPRSVHGIWTLIKTYLDSKALRLQWKAAPQLLTLTNDGAWHDLDITAYTSTTCKAVNLACRLVSGGRWVSFLTRKKGSSADYEGIFASEGHDAGFVVIDNAGGMINDQVVDDDGIFEYKLAKEGTFTAHIVSYWDTVS